MNVKNIASILICFLLMLTAQILPVRAASLADDFSSLAGDANRSYERLFPNNDSFGGAAITPGWRSGVVRYSVSGVETIRIKIGAIRGTFVTPDAKGGYRMGYDGVYSGSGAVQLWLNGARDRLFINTGEQAYEVFYKNSAYQTQVIKGNVPAAAYPYGISVYCWSEEGQRGAPLSLKLTSAYPVSDMNGKIYYEEYTAQVPKGTYNILVELNDFEKLPDDKGNTAAYNFLEGSFAIMGVEMQGEEAMFGKPQTQQPQIPQSSSKAGKSGKGGLVIWSGEVNYFSLNQKSPAASSKPKASSSRSASKDTQASSRHSSAWRNEAPAESPSGICGESGVLEAVDNSPMLHELGPVKKSAGSSLVKIATAVYMSVIGICIIAAALKTLKLKKR